MISVFSWGATIGSYLFITEYRCKLRVRLFYDHYVISEHVMLRSYTPRKTKARSRN